MAERASRDDIAAPTRRRFLAGVAATSVAAWVPAYRVPAATAPEGFPPGVELYRQAYRNWCGTIAVDDVPTCAPTTVDQVLSVVNWARRRGWNVRAAGARHGWSPLTLAGNGPTPRHLLLIDTTRHFRAIEFLPGPPPAVRVQPGTSMLALLEFLHERDHSIAGVTAVGDATVGGVLAINGHGAGIPAAGERLAPGLSFGTLSNLVVSLDAVVFDPVLDRYVLRTFQRTHTDAPALLASLGRTFLTEVVLRVGPSQQQRCESLVAVAADELFASPEVGDGRTFSRYLDRSGRVESIWFPFTERPWLKVWTPAIHRPEGARPVSGPYNYPFSDFAPAEVAELARAIVTGNPSFTPAFGELLFQVVAHGLLTTDSSDLWGAAKDLNFYIRPSTLRVDEFGWAVLTSRANVQRVVHEFVARYVALRDAYRARDLYPMNMPLEIRASGVDDPADALVDGAVTPALSSAQPRSERPDWDVVVWTNALSLPGTHGVGPFLRELEQWITQRFDGGDGLAVPEWSKGWGYTAAGPWTDAAVLHDVIPGRLPRWDWAIATLDRLDPHRVFSNAFLDRFAVAR